MYVFWTALSVLSLVSYIASAQSQETTCFSRIDGFRTAVKSLDFRDSTAIQNTVKKASSIVNDCGKNVAAVDQKLLSTLKNRCTYSYAEEKQVEELKPLFVEWCKVEALGYIGSLGTESETVTIIDTADK